MRIVKDFDNPILYMKKRDFKMLSIFQRIVSIKQQHTEDLQIVSSITKYLPLYHKVNVKQLTFSKNLSILLSVNER